MERRQSGRINRLVNLKGSASMRLWGRCLSGHRRAEILVDPRRKPTLAVSRVTAFTPAEGDAGARNGRCAMKNGEDRKGKFIAVANMKGGVGKTTTVVSLAEALSADDENAKILVIDLDPQASASVAIASDTILASLIENERTLEAFLETRLIKRLQADVFGMIHRQILGTWHQARQLNVGLLPCGPHLRVVEKELIYDLAKAKFSISSMDGQITKLFQNDILPLGKHFDFILFDCAPGISPVTEIAIRLSDLVIVPTIPDYLSVYGLNAFYESIWNYKAKGLPSPKQMPSLLVTRMQKNIRQHREGRCHIVERRTREFCVPNIFKRPRLPRVTCS